MSSTLFGWVARLYLGLFVLCLVCVALVYLAADLGDRLNTFVNHPASAVAEFYWHKGLMTVHQLSPAAMLLAAGVTVSVLRRRSEWTAIQALGGSRWTLTVPIVSVAAVLAAGFVAFDEWVVTKSGERVDSLLVHRFGRWGDYSFFYFPKQWFRVGSDIVHVRGGVDASGNVSDVTVYRLTDGFKLTSRIDAQSLQSQGGSDWLLRGAVERRFESEAAPVSRLDDRTVTLRSSDPQTFHIRAGRPEQMTFEDLRTQQAIRARVGLPVERFGLAMHNRFAYPTIGVAAAFLAISLALRPSRRGHLTLALIEGLLVSLALFTFMLTGKALVLGEHVSPGVAAWAPVAGLVLLALGMWARAERWFQR